MIAASPDGLVGAIVGCLLVGGSLITLAGALGLIRLRTFYERAHGPTLGTTLGTAFIALGSLINSTALSSRLAVHEVLIIVLVTITTPVSLIFLVRAAVFRDEAEGKALLDDPHKSVPENC
jgi:multicomponent K+:H+ antiporter subunit G